MGGIDRSLIAAAPISDAGGQVPGDDAAPCDDDDARCLVPGDDDAVQDGDDNAMMVFIMVMLMLLW